MERKFEDERTRRREKKKSVVFIRKMVVAISDNWPNADGRFVHKNPKLDIATQNDHSN